MKLEGFDLNVLTILRDSLDSHIKTGRNILGASDISFCARANIIKNIYGIKTPLNNKMLFGMMFESIIYKPEVLASLICHINDKLEIPISELKTMVVDTKAEDYLEVTPDHFLRLHPDVKVFPIYIVEIKTTAIYTREWKKELALYQANQLNCYLGFYKIKLGFILKVNSRVFLSAIKHDDFYWDKLWNNYGYTLPFEFDEELYIQTLDRAKYLFRCINNEGFKNEVGPEMIWECAYCNPEIKKICGQPIIKKKLDYYQDCDRCNKKIKEKEFAYFRNENVYCTEDSCIDYVKSYIIK